MNYAQLMTYVEALKNTQYTYQLEKALTSILHEIGFQQFAYFCFKKDQISLENCIYTYSQVWMQQYLKNHYHKIDPILYRASEQKGMFCWCNQQYQKQSENNDVRQFCKQAQQYGINCGIAIPLKSVTNRKAVIVCVCSQEGGPHFPNLEDDILKITVSAVCNVFHHQALELSTDADVSLKTRESQILHLSAIGLSSEEAAIFLGLNKDYVHEVVSNILNKLGTRNRVAAVYRSQELGLINKDYTYKEA